ncbi:serine/threonine-protein kinase [Streptomyces poonensis]|uniref:Protein kinase n=1 Tax=Streptomyces poonensis TaxID=68255 RepID=A0A918PGN0_9ACTN|nr:serine/threonine-protein kinase [Streptomyces poonensis]GGZ08144.1 protein kinase [Streptomyces poonensis]GLJ88455.1 protein kinase [Streptomyces poonensis]
MDMAMMRLRREDPRVVGSFRLHRRLGAGGMGVVYLGSDRKGQRVALKVIRPDLAEDQEFRSRFAREVSAARRIRGGCTARLVAADLEADRPWFATQYVPGPSLHDKVTQGGPLPAAEVAAIGAALSEGLVAVHEAGVVHRDLKPSNILLSPKGPRIIDFGIAWATGASTLTHVGTAVGSPGFLAPEQVRGAAVTPATDVFALGATLAYSATSDSPFGHGSSEVMLYRVVHEEPQLHGVPDALAPLVRACLAKDPEERPDTLQLSLRLKEIAAREAQGLTDVRPPAPRTDPDRPSGRLAGPYAEQRTQRRRQTAPGTPSPRTADGSRTGSGSRTANGTGTGSGSRTGGSSRTGGGSGSRSSSGARPVQQRTSRSGGRPAPRSGAGRPAARTNGTAGRRPANPRLLRQRLIVFVVVTLLVALGIAAAQGCQGPARGLDDGRVREDVRQEQSYGSPRDEPVGSDPAETAESEPDGERDAPMAEHG